ncbi:MAG: HAMP domain-containing protein [Desulfamplus sp.]|nr:HAMP domain-containing protein [Desulfamplus sp.]
MIIPKFSFRAKISSGFVIIILLFSLGLGLGMIGMARISDIMGFANRANQFVRQMYVALETEKLFQISSDPNVAITMTETLGNLKQIIHSMKMDAYDDSFLQRLEQAEVMTGYYQHGFDEIAAKRASILELRARMQEASEMILAALNDDIRTPILDQQNMALVMGEEVSPILDEILKSIQIIGMDVKDARIQEMSYMMEKNPECVDIFNEKAGVWAKIRGDLKFLFDTLNDPNFLGTFQILDENFAIYSEKNFNEIFSLCSSSEILSQKIEGYGEEIRLTADHIQTASEKFMQETKNFTDSMTLVILFVCIVTGTVLTIVIPLSILKPLNQVLIRLKAIAQGEGDLTSRIKITSSDEVGELATSFNLFMEKLHSMITEIAQNSETLTVTSSGLSDFSGDISTGIKNMFKKSNTIAGASGELTVSMGTASSAMEKALGEIAAVSEASKLFSSKIDGIVKSSENAHKMTALGVKETDRASLIVHDLGKMADEIGIVTETITEISAQTNLLALNASIEAARAGSAGRGFAVVAGEIKALALETSKATLDIKDKIGSVQNSTSETVKTIEKITEIINGINSAVAEVVCAAEAQAVTTKDISERINSVAGEIDHTGENVSGSHALSAEIAREIADINHDAGNIAEGADKVNKSSDNLNRLATRLRVMVGEFKI